MNQKLGNIFWAMVKSK